MRFYLIFLSKKISNKENYKKRRANESFLIDILKIQEVFCRQVASGYYTTKIKEFFLMKVLYFLQMFHQQFSLLLLFLIIVFFLSESLSLIILLLFYKKFKWYLLNYCLRDIFIFLAKPLLDVKKKKMDFEFLFF